MSYIIEKRDMGYLLFVINRQDKRNAINFEVMKGLTEAISRAEEPDIKALVITGAGDLAFSSGGDLSVFHLLRTKEESYSMLSQMAEILFSLLTMSKPTMALLNGPAVGGGCELAAACDFRLAKEGIKAGFVQGKQAITTGWGGGSILAEKLTPAHAMKLLMEAEPVSTTYLKDLGFVDDTYIDEDSLKACENFLGKLLAVDVNVLQSYKRIWADRWRETDLRRRIEAEVRNCSILWESEAHHEYVKKFMQKK